MSNHHSSQPHPSFPSGRFAKTNPLRRLFGLQTLGALLPEPVRLALIRAWMYPARFDGNQTIQSLSRQRPAEARFPFFPPSRRIVETARTDITREMRNTLLRSQATYLSALYTSLAEKLGEHAAQAEFERLALKIA